MTLKEAYDIIKQHQILQTPRQCIEFASRFVFYFGPEGQMDFMFSVDKKTKEVKTFAPWTMPLKEFQNPIKTYKFKNRR